MSKLVHRDPQEISSRWGIMGKCFVFIKMGPSVLRVIRMRQHTSRSVKRIWTSSFHSCAVMTVSSKTETKFLILWFGERRWRIDWISSCREGLSSCKLGICNSKKLCSRRVGNFEIFSIAGSLMGLTVSRKTAKWKCATVSCKSEL